MHKHFHSIFPDLANSDIRQVYSPYRICPVGAHIDHQHGHVTGFALDKGVELLYIPIETGVINLFSLDFDGQVIFHLESIQIKYNYLILI